MINRLVYTYHTAKGSNLLAGFHSIESMLSTFKESLENSKKFFEKVVIYTDLEGSEFLNSKEIECEMVIIDYSKYEWNKLFWNYPKLITYNLQDDPFLHLDMDFILHNKPENLKERVLCEKIRGLTMFSRDRSFLPKMILDNYNPNNICSGALGGDPLVFKKLFDISSVLVKNKSKDIGFNHIFAIEEIVLTSLCKINDIAPKPIDCDFTHYQGSEAKMEILEKELNYII